MTTARTVVVCSTLQAILLLTPSNVNAQNATKVPPQVLQSWKYFLGEWEISGKVGDVPVTGGAAFAWTAGRHCFFSEQIWLLGKEERPMELTSLSGWDAKAQRTVECGFSTAGGSAIIRYATSLTDPNAKRTLGRAEGVGSGDARPWAGEVTIDRISANEFRLTTVVAGSAVHQLTYRRAQPPK